MVESTIDTRGITSSRGRTIKYTLGSTHNTSSRGKTRRVRVTRPHEGGRPISSGSRDTETHITRRLRLSFPTTGWVVLRVRGIHRGSVNSTWSHGSAIIRVRRGITKVAVDLTNSFDSNDTSNFYTTR